MINNLKYSNQFFRLWIILNISLLFYYQPEITCFDEVHLDVGALNIKKLPHGEIGPHDKFHTSIQPLAV